MRNIEIPTDPPKRIAVAITVFDPWPFREKTVDLSNAAFYDGYEPFEFGGEWCLNKTSNTLITLSDDSLIVCSETDLNGALRNI